MSDGNHIAIPELKTEPIVVDDANAHAGDPAKTGQPEGDKKIPLESLKTGTDNQPKRTAEQVAQDQEDAWTNNIIAGKASIETLEENSSLKTWLLPRVQGRLDKLSGKKQVEPEQKDKMDFSTIEAYEKQKLHTKNLAFLDTLPTKLHNEMVTQAKGIVAIGGNPVDTLDKILKDNAEKLTSENQEKVRKRDLQQLPSVNAGGGGTRTTYKMSELAELPQAEYSRIRDLADKGEVDLIN